MNEAMPSLLPTEVRDLDEAARKGIIAYYNNITFGAFLLGGALGGVIFGIVSDRIGRKRTMSLTILLYSLFTFVSALSQAWWHMAVFRFLVALGVGGEWAVASALVAEVFPKRARAWSLGIFHASSVLGTFLAVAAGAFLIGNPQLFGNWARQDPSIPWRAGFMVGVIPSLLIIWIRRSLKEPEHWEQARHTASEDVSRRLGSFGELFAPAWRSRMLIGVGLAAVGLATFWGVHIYGKDLLRTAVKQELIGPGAKSSPAESRSAAQPQDLTRHLKRWEMLGMLLVTAGGGLGLVSFGPLCERLGRRLTFALYHFGGLVSALVTFRLLHGSTPIMFALPIFGFLTLGMHAGYAIYFPELFPTRLRATGAGFCFNVGRIVAAPMLFLSGWMQKDWGYSLENAVSLLAILYLMGAILPFFAPETRGQELPE